MEKSHLREWVDVSVPTYQMRARPSENPTHGSGWIVQIQPTRRVIWSHYRLSKVGFEQSTNFRWWDSQISKASVCRLDLNNPPTPVGGIPESFKAKARRLRFTNEFI